jgi:flagellar basal-body rod protein FlgG
MNRILQTGRTGLDSIQKKMDVIAHNIANAQTDGYKSLNAHFGDLVYDRLANRGIPQTEAAREKPVEIGTGSRIKDLSHSFEQGVLRETSNPLDLAIEGRGFFGVQGRNGEILLTRDGAFSLDAEGRLADSAGNYVVMDMYVQNADLSGQEISIDERGLVTVTGQAGQTIEIGRILLFDVNDKASISSIGDNYFSPASQDDLLIVNDQTGIIRQGFLESSSVDLVKELTEMLITQRAYSINTRSIHAADEMWSMVNQLRR